MKKFILVTLLGVGCVTTNLNAQEKKERIPQEDHMEMRMKKMEKHLELTPEQSKQLRQIHHKHAAKKTELRGELKKLHEAEKSELKQVLSEEQFKKLQDFKKEQAHQKKQHTCDHPSEKQNN